MKTFRPDIEMSSIENFRRRASGVSEVALPQQGDRLGWLLLIQHYRSPTRLLDWSENALVALFFAVWDDPEKDGELFALYPQRLNSCSTGTSGIPIESAGVLLYFLEEL